MSASNVLFHIIKLVPGVRRRLTGTSKVRRECRRRFGNSRMTRRTVDAVAGSRRVLVKLTSPRLLMLQLLVHVSRRKPQHIAALQVALDSLITIHRPRSGQRILLLFVRARYRSPFHIGFTGRRSVDSRQWKTRTRRVRSRIVSLCRQFIFTIVVRTHLRARIFRRRTSTGSLDGARCRRRRL